MVALDNECFNEPFRFSSASMRSFAEAKKACVVVAEAGGQLAAFCILHVERSRRREIGYIVTLDVDPAFRRQGLASQCMHAVEQMAAADGCKTLALHVYVKNNVAISFYETLGFMYADTITDFYEEGLDALLLQKPLSVTVDSEAGA
jgi:ribosomal-protein-alanine N-acetyltransferase